MPKRPLKPGQPGGKESLRDLAYRHLQTKLSNGDLPAGELLSEIPLARELGISRTPVREAIGLLAAEGFLEQIPNRGTVVRQLASRDIVDLYELREALEVYAVGKVAQQKLGPAQKQELRGHVEQVQNIRNGLLQSGAIRLDKEGMQALGLADLSFHNLILRLAGNARMLKVATETRLLIRIFSLPHAGHDAAQLRDIHQYHRRIAEAIDSGDASGAQRLLAEHIQLSMRERLDAHETWERELHLSRAMAGSLGSAIRSLTASGTARRSR